MVAGPATVQQTPDALLVAGVLAGDPVVFAAVYDRYADGLHDFCLTLFRDRDRAAAVVWQVFGRVPERLARLRNPHDLGPWLYAMARDESLRPVGRSSVPWPDEEPAEPSAGPPESAEQDLLADLAFEAEFDLPGRDRALLCLHLRHGMNTAELAAAAGTSERRVAGAVDQLRERFERGFRTLLLARLQRPLCAELGRLFDGWDGRLTKQRVQRVSEHVEQCPACGMLCRKAPNPLVLLAAPPRVPAPPRLRASVLDSARLDRPRARPLWIGRGPAVTLLVLALAIGGLVIWQDATARTTPVVEAQLSTTTAPAPPKLTDPTAAQPAEATTQAPVAEVPAAPPAPSPSPHPAPSPGSAPSSPGRGSAVGLSVVQQSASPAAIGVGGCATDRTTVTAVLSGSPVFVVLVWTGSAGRAGVVPMQRSGDTWRATLGPFDVPGAVTWQVGAGDGSGAMTKGQPGTVNVTPCTNGELR